jgi:hypothetical protein
LLRQVVEYFQSDDIPANGLVADKTQECTPASIAAIGLVLAAQTVGVERGFVKRTVARQLTLATCKACHSKVSQIRGSVQNTEIIRQWRRKLACLAVE